jgi:3-hydroxyisobutyrate dehydrogenase
LNNRFEAVLTGSQNGWWTTMLGAKDAGLALDIARGADVELPAASVVQRLYEKAASSGLDDADIAAVTELYRGPAAASTTPKPDQHGRPGRDELGVGMAETRPGTRD